MKKQFTAYHYNRIKLVVLFFRGCECIENWFKLLDDIELHCDDSAIDISVPNTKSKYNFMCCAWSICCYHPNWSLYWIQLEVHHSQYCQEGYSKRFQNGNYRSAISNKRCVIIFLLQLVISYVWKKCSTNVLCVCVIVIFWS